MQVPQRGSIHSLPDATAFQRPVPRGSTLSVNQPYSTNDPVLAIDALVAELELNTEPVCRKSCHQLHVECLDNR